MQTLDEAREHCRFVGKGSEKMVPGTSRSLQAEDSVSC